LIMRPSQLAFTASFKKVSIGSVSPSSTASCVCVCVDACAHR
jgi:hypothetical protein